MSRFFKGGSDSDSSSESSSSSSEDEAPQVRSTVGGGTGRSRFLASDSEEEDVKRVIRSAANRRYRALVEVSINIKNHIKVGDWSKLEDDFNKLNEGLRKIRKTDLVSGRAPPVPDVYLRSVITIEDLVLKTVKEKPRLSKTNATSLNKLKLRVPKNNKEYKEEIQKLRAGGKPTLYDVDYNLDDDEDEDNDESSSESDSSSSDSDSDDGVAAPRKSSRWIKKTEDKSEATTKRVRKAREKETVVTTAEDPGEQGDDEGFTTVAHSRAAKQTFNPDEMNETMVDQKLIEILTSRGRKGTNRQDQITLIESLVPCAKTEKQKLEIMLHLVAAQFDAIPAAKLFMPAKLWNDALENAVKVVKMAAQVYPNIRFSDEHDTHEDDSGLLLKGGVTTGEIVDHTGSAMMGTAAPNLAEQQLVNRTEIDREGAIIVRGDIAVTFERLDDELYKAWQNVDAYSTDYVDRLKDEVKLLDLSALTQTYFETAVKNEEGKETINEDRISALRAREARIAARRINHMYFKSDELNKKVEELTGRPASDKTLTELSALVYRFGDERAKSQTMLTAIYKDALENRFFEARDLLLMSHLQETIQDHDIPLQVMFNRTMTQLGLCAFRLGKPWEAHACLTELCSPSHGGGGGGPARLRELLAQGISQQRNHEKTPEQEKAEIRRQIPYHMHMNLDFIETAHLTSAMLLEVPAMALSKSRGDVRRYPISKSFQYFLRNSMKQAFPGPPENTRDYVMAATRCLMKGDWQGAYNHIKNIRSWKSLSISQRTETLERIKGLLQVEALRTFALSYSSYFESMSTTQLSELFGLGADQVHSTLSKMIINKEMRASWDQPTSSIVMRRTEPTRLQSLALQLGAKAANMLDNNEKLLDAKSGGGDRDRGGAGGADRKDDRDARDGWKQGSRSGSGRVSNRGGRGSRLPRRDGGGFGIGVRA